MKKLILAAALLLSAAGARSPFNFNDPIPDCPPACQGNNGNIIAIVQ
jgi:hypothetical protein